MELPGWAEKDYEVKKFCIISDKFRKFVCDEEESMKPYHREKCIAIAVATEILEGFE